MSKEKKAATIDKLREVLAGSNAGVFTDFRGLATPDMLALRGKLKEAGAQYRVIKNTLSRLAAEKAGKGYLVSFFEEPTALAFGHGDITELAKVIAEYVRGGKTSLRIKGGFLGDKVFTSQDVMTISTLPPREVLLAKVLQGLQSPIAGLIQQLAAPIAGTIGLLQARIRQLEGQS
ncbi:MAG: 50S ribosomal protein L10 [Chloroflexi bacterium]|nr:50S ribosomal protein L10 [Chloroflexota bacterium]